ncbi:MAG: FAD-dependent oxidoreductase [Oscillospiraceae bacterium]|nr:FAD-dependent oxidoreductase [Oscillospiraceae bacterium]
MESVWQKTEQRIKYPSLKKDIDTDVLVIGGGMAGILCARKLQDAGKRVVLVEAERIGSGITARTTAVLTAQHDYLYQDMERDFGEEIARAYLHANLDAVAEYRKLSEKISCDFETLPSIQYTAKDPARLEKEVQTVNRLGFPARFEDNIPLDVLAVGASVYPDMGQFHPLKFLMGVAEGLEIYENSRVLDLEGTTAKLEKCTIRAKQVIVATHFPFINRHGLYFVKLYQNRSYVLALENAPNPASTLAELEGLGLYFRPYGDLLIMGGGDHRTGQKGGGWEYLRTLARKYFPDSKERFAWANQDCMTLDGLPYVGQYAPGMPGVYVATGFNAWGMTNSMAAANLLRDMLLGKENPLEKVFDPNRSLLHKQLWCNLGATVADFAIPTKKRCPHLGCALKWNSQEHSWDCPCHGSRFTESGKLLDTPAQKDADV